MARFSMTVGNASIDVEGDASEIQALVGEFWTPRVLAGDTSIPDAGAESEDRASPGRDRKGKNRSKPGSAPGKTSEEEVAIANKMKTHAKSSLIQQKVILAPADWLRKIQAVIYCAEAPLHSGSISRALSAAGVKNSLPTISKTLSNNRNLFITSGKSPETYDFTARSKQDFENWLEKKGEDS